jgi:hypothetical protein
LFRLPEDTPDRLKHLAAVETAITFAEQFRSIAFAVNTDDEAEAVLVAIANAATIRAGASAAARAAAIALGASAVAAACVAHAVADAVDTAFAAAGVGATVRTAATRAARAADAADTAVGLAFVYVYDAETLVVVERAADDAMHRDLELLLETARAKGWTDATPVPPESFGPLWPDGPLKGWPTKS